MNNKEFQKKYDELIKQRPEYLYQRYLGRITKYKKLDEDTYISCSDVGMIFKRDEHLLLGKWSNRLYDLIEVGDYVNGHKVIEIEKTTKCIHIDYSEHLMESVAEFEIKTIVTKEQFKEMEFKIE